MKEINLAVTDTNFRSEILESDIPALVDFWAAWCGPCMAIAPVIQDLAVEYDGRIKVRKLNVDQNPEMARKFGIRSIPTLALFKNGVVTETIVGARAKAYLEKFISPHISG